MSEQLWPNVEHLLIAIKDVQDELKSYHLEETEVRLQVTECSWDLHSGDPSYDTDHRGWWGAAVLLVGYDDEELRELAEELLAEAQDHWSQSEEQREGEQAEGPSDGDYTSTDFIQWYQFGKLVLTVPEGEDYRAAIRAHMDRERYWPGVWWISDHGNAHPVQI